MKLFNIRNFLSLRKELRNNPMYSEKLLWNELKNSSFLNLKFRRQHGIGKYIVDFYCREKNLVIEVDGEMHDQKEVSASDKIRDEFLKSKGLKVLKFSSKDVVNNLTQVLEEIKNQVC